MPSFPTSDGARIDYTESGASAGRPVVLLAGFRAPAGSWFFQRRVLEQAAYRVLALERRDDGESIARLGADLHEFLTSLDLRGAVLVGADLGASVIWSAVQQFGADRIGAIAVVDQPPRMLNDEQWPHGFYDYDQTVAGTLFAAGIPDPGRHTFRDKGVVRIARLIRAMRPGLDRSASQAELALWADHAAADWRTTVAGAELPIVFFAGSESEYYPASHAAASAALTPDGTSVVLDHDGHAAHIERPQAFNEALLAFLQRS
jgi:pimeloyl-ACP methyl ester carboxylesterase